VRDTNTVSALTESKVLTTLVSAGFAVALPFGVAKYDLIIDGEDGLKRVQCKTGRLKNGAVSFNVYSVRRRPGGGWSTISYQGEIDLFGVYCPQNDKVYLVPVNEHVGTISLRVESPRNGQKTKWRAEDYEIIVVAPADIMRH
jgi:hypothetical protein